MLLPLRYPNFLLTILRPQVFHAQFLAFPQHLGKWFSKMPLQMTIGHKSSLQPLIMLVKKTWQLNAHHLALSILSCKRMRSLWINSINPSNYKSAKSGPDSTQWTIAENEEQVRLIETTKTMVWIDPQSKPVDRIASYYHPQVKLKWKEGHYVYRVRGVYGGNISDYVGMTSSTSSDMQTFKLLLNAVVSEDSQFMTADISDFYLGSPLSRPEYMRLTRDQVPATTQARYGDAIIWVNDSTMVQINNGIYGLPQSGFLSKQKLVALLARNGYHMTPTTECLFRHESLNIAFALVVDDFAIKYADRAAAEHLLATIRQEYRVEPDWEGSLFLGMSIAFDKPARSVSLSMPGYVDAALKRFHVTLGDSPLKYYPTNYGSTQAQEVIEDTTPALSAQDKTFIQQ